MGCLRTLRKVAVISLVVYSCVLVWMLAFVMIVKGDNKRK